MRRMVVPLVLLLASASPVAAAWQTGVIEAEEDDIHFAAVADQTGAFRLQVVCWYELGERGVRVTSSEPWMPEATYPAQVPVSFTIDGVPISEIAFAFEDDAGALSIVVGDWEQDIDPLLNALFDAATAITVSYLDTAASFPTSGISEALVFVDAACIDL